MAIVQEPVRARLNGSTQLPADQAAATAATHGAVMTTHAAKLFAVLRVALGFVFLWAFLDKTFGFGYATPSAKAWIHGGSPTMGFLKGVEVGPFQAAFHSWAGTGWANWLFMLGLLGIGLALILGVALRAAAVSGTLLLVLMWAAVATGPPHRSGRPVDVDQPADRLPHPLRIRAYRRGGNLRRQHLGVRQDLGRAAVYPAEPLAAVTL